MCLNLVSVCVVSVVFCLFVYVVLLLFAPTWSCSRYSQAVSLFTREERNRFPIDVHTCWSCT